jgi:hypothetical protein
MDACDVWFHCQVDLAQGIQGGKFYIGWPLITTTNVTTYYPETVENPKGHLNQTRKNIRSTKPALLPLEVSDATTLQGKKQRDVFTQVYDVRETFFFGSNWTVPQEITAGQHISYGYG